jgi:hypothetical protein
MNFKAVLLGINVGDSNATIKNSTDLDAMLEIAKVDERGKFGFSMAGK